MNQNKSKFNEWNTIICEDVDIGDIVVFASGESCLLISFWS